MSAVADKVYTKEEISYRDGGATLKRLEKELTTASAERKEEIEKLMKLYKKECWIIMYGKVYDVTKFLVDHPGGPESILGCAGKVCMIDMGRYRETAF